MIQSTKWYGLKAKDPKSYFDNNCHSYQDISDLISTKGVGIIKDIAPCIESFMQKSDDIISDDLMDKLIISDTYNSICVANEAVSYTIDNIGNLKSCADNSSWFIWSDIPHIERAYRMGKVNESAIEILNTALESCAEKVASNFTSFDTDRIEPVVEEFINNVTWDDMIHWKDRRDSIMESSSISGYIGDLITEISPSNWRDLALDGKQSNFDACLENIAGELRYKNPDTIGSFQGYKDIVLDIYTEMSEATEGTFDTVVENLYVSRQMTISTESFMDSIHRMIKCGMLPALENVSEDKFDVMEKYLKGESAVEGANPNIKEKIYNLDMWKRQPGMNKLYVIEYDGCSRSWLQNFIRKTPNVKALDVLNVIKADAGMMHFVNKFDSPISAKLKNLNPSKDLSDNVKYTLENLLKEPDENPDILYVLIGVYPLHEIDPNYFKGKPVIILGASTDPSRAKIIQAMSECITESAILESNNIIDTYGKLYGIEDDMRAFEMMSFDYIPATEAIIEDNSKEQKVTDKNKVVRKVKEGVKKSEVNITRAYNKYKMHEDDVDEKLTHAFKKCKELVFGSPEEARRQMVEGKGYSVVNVLKYVLGGIAVFSVSKVAFFLILIVRWCNNGKIKSSERRKIIEELKAEQEVLEQKIEDARMEGNKEAVYALIRTKNNVQAALKRIKKREEAERGGIGAKDILIKRH